jgi:hypothetical protein
MCVPKKGSSRVMTQVKGLILRKKIWWQSSFFCCQIPAYIPRDACGRS